MPNGQRKYWPITVRKIEPLLKDIFQASRNHLEDVNTGFKKTDDQLAGPGGAHVSEIPDTGAGGEKYGVAERVREERAKPRAGFAWDFPWQKELPPH